jgi:hypothetical protein
VKRPEAVDMVIFRENTEDIYAGIEYAGGTPEAQKVLDFLAKEFPKDFKKIRFGTSQAVVDYMKLAAPEHTMENYPPTVGVGIKPVSQVGTIRLFKAAVLYAIEQKRKSVTIVHKGNIMKFTEGAFRDWSYAAAERIFGDKVYTWAQWERTKKEKGEAAANDEQKAALAAGRILIKDAIADTGLRGRRAILEPRVPAAHRHPDVDRVGRQEPDAAARARASSSGAAARRQAGDPAGSRALRAHGSSRRGLAAARRVPGVRRGASCRDESHRQSPSPVASRRRA